MVIGFDLRALQVGFKAHLTRGIGTYALNLAKRLPEMDTAHRYVFFVEKGERLAAEAAGLETIEVASPVPRFPPVGRRTIRHQLLFPRNLSRLGLDLAYFASHLDAPARFHGRRAMFIHDLIPFVLSDLYLPDRVSLRFRFAQWMERTAARNADGILVNSQTTKKDVVRLFGIPPERIAVTPLAPARSFSPPADPAVAEATLDRLGITRPYLLYLGGIDPRKNMHFLMRSYARAIRKGLGPDRLVLAGRIRDDEQYPVLLAWVREAGIADRVQILDTVPFEDLAALYAGATAFLYPSLYEGFGLPPIEAMACGTPVIASNRGSLPEVLGDAGLLLDPCDEDGFARAIVSVTSGSEIAQRLRRKGPSRAAEFTWERTAGMTIDAFRRLLAGEPLSPADV